MFARVLTLDTTLRDGEPSPGRGMTQQEDLPVTRALAEPDAYLIKADPMATARPGSAYFRDERPSPRVQ
jgi:isopropylmalate/homocitrate/citramalate synthase